MKSNCNKNDANEHDSELSLDDSRELLAEVKQATRGTQAELYEFACLVCQVIELYERGGCHNEGDGAIEFIADSLQEIRSVIAADKLTSEPMESLVSVAVDRWGDQLTTDDELDAQQSSADESDEWDTCEEQEFVADADLVAPSAEEISSLLNQLGRGSTSTSDVPQDEPAAQSEPAQTTSADVSEESIDSLDDELKEAFLDDASSCVSSMEDSLLRLESDPQNTDAVNQICRELHTLKGAAGSVGLSRLAEQLHVLEDQLGNDQAAGKSPAIDSLLSSVDSIRSQIFGNQEGSSCDLPLPSTLKNDISPSSIQPNPSFDDGGSDDESVRVKSSQLNRLMDMLAELVMLRNRRETEVSELQEVYHELIGSVSKMRLLSNEGHSQAIASNSLQLSEIANDVLEVAQNVRACARPVADGNTAVSQFIRQFRQELVELRRTPVSGLFRRLQRVVRDAAQAESKEVRLELLGEDAGIERSLQQRLYEPLLHIVRNSVCHGIESAEARSRSGKHRVGTITLEAKSGPDLFVIEIRDDGGGLDYDAIRRRGLESGLLAANQSASREELSQLIFQPGFSTRQTVNQAAGRGVGMDVVASTLKRMRGWLEVDSTPQQGTRIRISIPLPSVIQHVMVFRSAGQLFALPMQSVQSAGEVDRDSLDLMFSDLLGIERESSVETCQRIVLACETPTSDVAGGGKTRVTLLVDEIVGPEEVVVRPLPALLKQHPFCSGATLSGMGQTVLVLDARRVVESQSHHLHRSDGAIDDSRRDRESDQTNPTRTNRARANPTQSMRPRVLVVDDSLSARKRVVRSLQRYPIEIVEACDGKEAVEILKDQQFAAVFSDMEMPHISGMELLAEINSGDRSDPPPVVIISSRHEEEFTSRAKQLGANGYLIKPLADDALDGAITAIASLRHLHTDLSTGLQPSGEIQ